MWNFLLFFSQYNFLLHFIPLEEFSSRNFLILLIKLFNFNEDNYFLSTCIIGTIITVILLSLSPRQTILQFLIPLILKKHTVNRHVHYCRTIIFKFHPKSVHLSTVAAKILGKILKEKSWRVTLRAISSYLIDVLEQLDCTDCIRKGIVAAPINLRSLESRFPVRGCGQTVDLSANKRTKKSTEREERKEKRREESRKKNAECEKPASQFALPIRLKPSKLETVVARATGKNRNSKKIDETWWLKRTK